ncbi:MAG TPA: DUF5060 domain-containing protein, partial [Anaerolineae bacterium]|nr:DUF5060 domain-containing protein [Anaerolineae bacterium]
MNNPVHSQENQTGLYETWELQLTNDKEYKNPFKFSEIQLEAIFTSPSANQFKALGFYDGDGNGGQTGNVWKLRFMPNETGQWTYTFTWSDGTAGGSGKFTVTKQTNPKNHGHVQVDPVHPRYLIHDDGTAHYWWGANWMTSELFGPESKWGEQNPTAEVTDTDLIDYLDSLEQYNHNGLLIKFGFYPLENNTYSWDLFWLHKKEWFIQEMAARGIYAQINIFDTWSRTPPGWSVDTDGDEQVLNVWSPGDEAAKENYI